MCMDAPDVRYPVDDRTKPGNNEVHAIDGAYTGEGA